jgi:hypothetical protein
MSMKIQDLFTKTGLPLNSLSKMIFLENRAKILYLLFEILCDLHLNILIFSRKNRRG